MRTERTLSYTICFPIKTTSQASLKQIKQQMNYGHVEYSPLCLNTLAIGWSERSSFHSSRSWPDRQLKGLRFHDTFRLPDCHVSPSQKARSGSQPTSKVTSGQSFKDPSGILNLSTPEKPIIVPTSKSPQKTVRRSEPRHIVINRKILFVCPSKN